MKLWDKLRILEKWQARFVCGFHVTFDYVYYSLSISKTQLHTFVKGNTAAHVPTYFEHFLADGFCLFFKLLDQFLYFFNLK